ELDLSNGIAQRYLGTVTFQGRAESPLSADPKVLATVRATDLDANDLQQLAGVNTGPYLVSGSVTTGAVRLSGTLHHIEAFGPPTPSNPEPPFNAELTKAEVNGLPIDSATVSGTYQNDVFRIPALQAKLAGGTATAGGLLRLSGKNSAVDLNVVMNGLNLESLAQAAPPSVDTGGIRGTLDSLNGRLGGTLTNLNATAQFAISDIGLRTMVVGDLSGHASYNADNIALRNVKIGDVDNPEVAGGELSIQSLMYNTRSHLIGSAENISLPAMISVTGLPLQFVRDLIAVSPFTESGAGRSVNGYLARIPGLVSGVVTGHADVGGSLENPVADISLAARNVGAANHYFNSVTASAHLTKQGAIPLHAGDHGFNVHIDAPVELGTESSTVDAYGTVRFKGDVNAEADIRNLNLSALRSWITPGTAGSAAALRKLAGAGDLFVVASGPVASPQLDISAQLKAVSYGGTTIADRLEVIHATVRPADSARGSTGEILFGSSPFTQSAQDGIRIERDAVSGATTHRLTLAAGGAIKGFSWSPPFVAADAGLDLRAMVEPNTPGGLNLNALVTLAPGALGPATSGSLQAEATVTGTRSKPDIRGSVTIDAPRLQFLNLATQLVNVKGGFTFDQDHVLADVTANSRVVVNGLFQKGKPSSRITLSGGLPVGLVKEQHQLPGLTLASTGLYFEESRLPDFKSGNVRGTADIAVKVTGSLLRPVVSGPEPGEPAISVHDAVLTLPTALAAGTSSPLALPVPVRFDNLTLRVGRNVRLISSELNAVTRGDITLNRTAL
ncbi:MAG TPA: hypothetical protein VGS41_06075, partial [Chthonomonadales bacterium]|nr:hypothetical protein [Chthonomonadales bacterium]